MVAAGFAWFAVFGALVFLAAGALAGFEGAMRLADLFATLDPRALGQRDPVPQRVFFGVGALIYLSGLAGVLSGAWLYSRRGWADLLGWRGQFPPMNALAWKLTGAALAYHVLASVGLRLAYPEFGLWILIPRDPIAMALSFVMIVLLAPLVEELVFRGWIFGALRARWSARATVLATAFLFAIVHLDASGLYPIAVLLPGFVLSVLRERTGNVKAAVFGHAVYNFVGWLLLLLAGIALGK
jgi:membrane protease YdiL (CAAX protease family)